MFQSQLEKNTNETNDQTLKTTVKENIKTKQKQ